MIRLHSIKRILSIEDSASDEMLVLLLKKCEAWVRSFCGVYDVGTSSELLPLPAALSDIVEDLAVMRYNKLGSEGLKAEGVGPLNMTYEELSPQTAAALYGFKRVRF